MSIVKDAQGNILNKLPHAVVAGKYSSGVVNGKPVGPEQALTRDWFDLHPEDRPTVTKTIVEDGQPVAVVPNDEVNAKLAQLVKLIGENPVITEKLAEQGLQLVTESLDGVIRTQDVVTGERTENGSPVEEFQDKLPSSADLDAVAEEQKAAEATVSPNAETPAESETPAE